MPGHRASAACARARCRRGGADLELLVGAGLLLCSFAALLNVDRGFQADRRVPVEINLPPQYGQNDGARARQFVLDFEARIRSLPGVVSAAPVSSRP